MSASTAPLQEEAPTPAPEKRRGADTRALTQVLFAELKELQPGTPEHHRVRGALIEANLPLVRYAAARFRSRNEPMEDVVQVGTIGLINAIDRFDPDRGVQFPTFAMPTALFMFDCGLWTTAVRVSASKSISRRLTWMQCAAIERGPRISNFFRRWTTRFPQYLSAQS